jgi:hypothetical protein
MAHGRWISMPRSRRWLTTQNSKLKFKIDFGHRFSFVHLLDFLAEKNLRFNCRRFARDGNRRLQKPFACDAEKRIARAHHRKFLGVPRENIICEYGMSELSSQAYDSASPKWKCEARNLVSISPVGARANRLAGNRTRSYRWRNRLDSRFRSGECFFRRGNPDGRFGRPPWRRI